MEQIKNIRNLNIIGAILILITFLFGGNGFMWVLNIGFSVTLAVSLIRNKKDIVALVGVAGLTLTKIIGIFMYFSLVNILSLLAYAALLGLLLIKVLPNVDEEKIMGQIPETFREYIALVPAAVNLVAAIANIVWTVVMCISYELRASILITSLISGVLFAVLHTFALLAIGLWIMDESVEAEKIVIPENTGTQGEKTQYAAVADSEGYYDIAMHVILLLVTCGIWQYIWIYRVTKYLNNCPGKEYRDPACKLLLCMFVPFYYIYWTYKSAERVDVMSNARGVPCDIATLCLILAIFVGIVPPILIQVKINGMIEGVGKPTVNPQPTQPTAETPAVNVAEEIRKFKELLDSGAITEEEYDAKKKQLLDM